MREDFKNGMHVDFDAPLCTVCGSPAYCTEYLYNIKERGMFRKRGGRRYRVLYERRAYYHCKCGCTVGSWQSPEYDEYNEVKTWARVFARKEWDAINKEGRK